MTDVTRQSSIEVSTGLAAAAPAPVERACCGRVVEPALAGLMQAGCASPPVSSSAAHAQAWAQYFAHALLFDCWSGEPLRLADFVA
jgi:hypothetical protein